MIELEDMERYVSLALDAPEYLADWTEDHIERPRDAFVMLFFLATFTARVTHQIAEKAGHPILEGTVIPLVYAGAADRRPSSPPIVAQMLSTAINRDEDTLDALVTALVNDTSDDGERLAHAIADLTRAMVAAIRQMDVKPT